MTPDSDPNQNQNLLTMTGLQSSPGTGNIRTMVTNTRINKCRSKCTWSSINGEVVKWQTSVNFFITVSMSVIIVLLEYGYIPSSTTGFICGDPSISHKYKGEIITPEILGILMALVPLTILLSSELIENRKVKDIDLFLILSYLKECTVGCMLTLLLTEVGKSIIAEHRPHFFDVCEPDTAKGCVNGTWIEEFTCTSSKYSKYFMMDSTRSFPSGHSSLSAFVGVYSVYLVHKRFKTSHLPDLIQPFLVSICLTFSIVCSLTRISDRRHHWWDVLIGDFIGLSLALYYIFISHRKFKKISESTKNDSTDLEHNNCIV